MDLKDEALRWLEEAEYDLTTAETLHPVTLTLCLSESHMSFTTIKRGKSASYAPGRFWKLPTIC